MPLTQTTLHFPAASSTRSLPIPPPIPAESSDQSRSTSVSSETLPGIPDADTIVVGGAPTLSFLPTPSDSSTDASSDSGLVLEFKTAPKDYSKLAIHSEEKTLQSHQDLLENKDEPKSRSVSGETLVAGRRQSSLLENSISALNIPWSMSSLFNEQSQEHLAQRDERQLTVESLPDTVNEESLERETKAAAKRAKMEENAKIWAARTKAAEEKASRRSSRIPTLEKAGEVVSGLAASVLGKRSREVLEKGRGKFEDLKNRVGMRPTSMIEPKSTTASASESPSKKRLRLSETDLEKPSTTAKPFKPLVTVVTSRKEKRWLNSGLYTGQTRQFDGRFNESKNKRKQNESQNPPIRENRVLPLPMFAGERLLQQGRDFKLPFDVFSPLPAGQPKPDEWRKTNKNVFIGDAAQFWRTSKFQEHSTCMCKPDTGCDSHCMNRFMFYECDDKNCNLTEEECGNRSFEGLRQRTKKGGKYNVGVEVIKTVDKGYGVRSNRTFEPNQIIVEYTGEIITQEECESRMKKLYKDNECYYLMLFDQNMIIDATRGSIARFVNHSCEPNCRMEKWTVGGKPRMALFAGERGIMTGEELTYDYNFDPFSQKNVQECRCGSKKCRGILGPRTKDDKKPKAEQEKLPQLTGKLTGAKRKITKVFEKKSSKVHKKRKATVSKTVLMKNPRSRSSNGSPNKSISRQPSVLKRIVNNAKERNTSKRAFSNSSAAEVLLVRSPKRPLSRSDSVKVKARIVKRNLVRTVKGAVGGKKRTIRHITLVDVEAS